MTKYKYNNIQVDFTLGLLQLIGATRTERLEYNNATGEFWLELPTNPELEEDIELYVLAQTGETYTTKETV